MNVDFTVYGQPQPAGSKKTLPHRQTGRMVTMDTNRKAYPWKRDVAQAAGLAMQGKPLLDGPLSLTLHFYVPRPKGHYGVHGLRPSAPVYPTTRPDVLKLARSCEDAMSGVVYRDDAQIVVEILNKSYGEPARCEARVTPLYQQSIDSGPRSEKAA